MGGLLDGEAPPPSAEAAEKDQAPLASANDG